MARGPACVGCYSDISGTNGSTVAFNVRRGQQAALLLGKGVGQVYTVVQISEAPPVL